MKSGGSERVFRAGASQVHPSLTRLGDDVEFLDAYLHYGWSCCRWRSLRTCALQNSAPSDSEHRLALPGSCDSNSQNSGKCARKVCEHEDSDWQLLNAGNSMHMHCQAVAEYAAIGTPFSALKMVMRAAEMQQLYSTSCSHLPTTPMCNLMRRTVLGVCNKVTMMGVHRM